jgi:8-oxo-dGTP diphosphatase
MNKRPLSPIPVSCAIIEHQGKVLAAQRGERMSHPGRWEFPGGKLEEGETAADCLKREIREEMGIDIQIHQGLPSVEFHYPDKVIELFPFICTYDGSDITLHEHNNIQWLLPEELLSLHWAEADIKVCEYYVKVYLPGR